VRRGAIVKTVNNVAYHPTLSFCRPYSRDEGTRSGPRPHFALIDEVHELPNGEVVNKLRAGFKSRKQPLALEITNSGYDRSSVCWDHHQHAAQILTGRLVDDRLFAYVCALDEGDDPLTDPTCWIKANPLLGVTITQEYLERQVENAQNIATEHNTVLRLNFCVWTQQQERAIDMARWDACESSTGVTEDELALAPCYAGLDLGMSDDFSAFVRIWQLDDGRVVVRPKFWVPEAALEKYPNRPYDAWRDAGWLDVTEGTITDYDVVEAVIADDCLDAGVRECAYDKRFAQQMAVHLEGQGITMVDMPQGFQLTGACTRVLELVSAGLLCHDGHPILGWMAVNFVLRHGRHQEVRPDKDAAAEKIDGMVALVMALARAMVQPVDQEIDPEVGVLRW